MKDCFYQYRKGLYEALNGNVSYDGVDLEVVEYAAQDQATPFIQIMGMTSSYERDDDKDSQWVTTDIMVVTSYEGSPYNFGSKQSDDIMNEIMELLITQGVTTADRAKFISMDDFTDNGCWFEGLRYDPLYDGNKIFIIKVLTIRTLIDE